MVNTLIWESCKAADVEKNGKTSHDALADESS